jgi:hypothetical protein
MNVVQDMIDAFWERPLAFAIITHERHAEDMRDIFAGRIYEDEVSEGLRELRKVVESAKKSGALVREPPTGNDTSPAPR